MCPTNLVPLVLLLTSLPRWARRSQAVFLIIPLSRDDK
jgi:hypothetical protein